MDTAALQLYGFSYFDDLRGRWVRARYKATRPDIEARYKQFRLDDEPEMRSGQSGQFMPPR